MVLVCLALGQSMFASGPCNDTKFHEFDFWIGAWSAANADGTIAGQNTITVEQGGTGQSMNYYDSFSNSGRQLWISPGER